MLRGVVDVSAIALNKRSCWPPTFAEDPWSLAAKVHASAERWLRCEGREKDAIDERQHDGRH